MSATLERRFGGVEDMHLLKGHSSIDDLLAALRSFEARLRGSPVVVDARDFFYSRISLAIGSDVLVQILDAAGNWVYCNETAAEYLGSAPRVVSRPQPLRRDPVRSLPIGPKFSAPSRRPATPTSTAPAAACSFSPPISGPSPSWSVLAFPITLHDGRPGVVLTARILERAPTLLA